MSYPHSIAPAPERSYQVNKEELAKTISTKAKVTLVGFDGRGEISPGISLARRMRDIASQRPAYPFFGLPAR
jgi:hypothetical protein